MLRRGKRRSRLPKESKQRNEDMRKGVQNNKICDDRDSSEKFVLCWASKPLDGQI